MAAIWFLNKHGSNAFAIEIYEDGSLRVNDSGPQVFDQKCRVFDCAADAIISYSQRYKQSGVVKYHSIARELRAYLRQPPSPWAQLQNHLERN